ncbi:MAG TPA: hypothetical protein VJI46_05965 [Candidatus Nanoarchaeia archaeon]|nr:hypothetical protein [Candidatus Nanoarchaeia archaeon]
MDFGEIIRKSEIPLDKGRVEGNGAVLGLELCLIDYGMNYRVAVRSKTGKKNIPDKIYLLDEMEDEAQARERHTYLSRRLEEEFILYLSPEGTARVEFPRDLETDKVAR